MKNSSLLTGTYQLELVLIHSRRQDEDISVLVVGDRLVGLAIRGHRRLAEGGSGRAGTKEERDCNCLFTGP